MISSYSVTSLVRPRMEELIPEKNSLEKIPKPLKRWMGRPISDLKFTWISHNYDLDFQCKRSEMVAMMMMVIVDGELMDVIEMMVDKQADLVVNLEANKVTKEMRKVD